MKIQLQLLTLITLIILNINFSYANSQTVPTVKLCMDKKCRTPYLIKISHDGWADVKELFSTPFSTDKDEQDNVINAIGIIEYDIYHSLASQPSQTLNADDLYLSNSTKNNYRNIKNILNVLLDKYMMKLHLMRKTISWKNWAGFQNTGLLLQSLSNSKLYLLQSNGRELGNSTTIKNYKKSSGVFDIVSDPANNSLNDDDFE